VSDGAVVQCRCYRQVVSCRASVFSPRISIILPSDMARFQILNRSSIGSVGNKVNTGDYCVLGSSILIGVLLIDLGVIGLIRWLVEKLS
jgi:hypothetical protein